MKENDRKRNQAGFTLVELMISLTIIIIVTAIAIPNFQKAGEKAQASGCEGNKKIIIAQMENYFMMNNDYPLTNLAGVESFYVGFDVNELKTDGTSLHKAYDDLVDVSDWYPVNLQAMKNEGFLQEIATCPKGGFYLVKIGTNGNAEEIMCSVSN